MLLTKQETDLVLNFRAQEALKDKPIKFGYLKENLYSCSDEVRVPDYHFYSKKDINAHIEKVKDSFTISLKKGTEFVCYSYNGRESWYDNVGYGCEDVHEPWASKYLNIKSKPLKSKSNARNS